MTMFTVSHKLISVHFLIYVDFDSVSFVFRSVIALIFSSFNVTCVQFQVTTLPDEFPDAHSTVNDLRLEYVVAVEGIVRSRPSESVNKKMKTGLIEVTFIT